MTGAIHALIGGAIGSLMPSRMSAFLAGVISHVPADKAPHKDFGAVVEVPALTAALIYIARRHGFDSPAMAGAIGAILPDLENALEWFGVADREHRVFPTHYSEDNHGECTPSALPQVPVGAVCVGVLEATACADRDSSDASDDDAT